MKKCLGKYFIEHTKNIGNINKEHNVIKDGVKGWEKKCWTASCSSMMWQKWKSCVTQRVYVNLFMDGDNGKLFKFSSFFNFRFWHFKRFFFSATGLPALSLYCQQTTLAGIWNKLFLTRKRHHMTRQHSPETCSKEWIKNRKIYSFEIVFNPFL